MEIQILKRLFEREVFDEYNKNIKADTFDGGRHSPKWKVFQALRGFYEKHDEEISPQSLKKIHAVRIQGLSQKEQERILDVYVSLAEEEDSTESTKELFREWRLSNLCYSVQEALEDRKVEEAERLLSDIREAEQEEEDLFSSIDIVEIVEANSGEGLECFLPSLRDYLPRLTYGTGQLIVARSNCGKTSWLTPQAMHVAKGGGKVLHFALSEDGQEELVIRYMQAAYHATEENIRANMEKARDRFTSEYGENIRIFNTGTCHIKELEKRIEAFKPNLVIYDQYQKVKTSGNKDASTPELRTRAASAIKDLAIKHNHHYICATQADKEAGWMVTDLNVDQAKTGVVGEFKTIIGIGKEDDDRLRTTPSGKQGLRRNINIAKNKGKMGSFVSYLVPDICKWEVNDG